jgi:hypothetical protein
LTGWDVLRDERFARQQKLGLHNTTLSRLEPDVSPPHPFADALKKLGPGEVDRPLPWTRLPEAQQRLQATKMGIHAARVDSIDREVGRVPGLTPSSCLEMVILRKSAAVQESL